MSNLELLWFGLICLLFIGFFFLEGFDFGVGMLFPILSDKEQEQDTLLLTIAPVWDGNEVWLITAIGGMFASFPAWYGTLLSGYYPLFLLIIVGLILRGVALHFHDEDTPGISKPIWTYALQLGSFLPPFLFGIIFASMNRGIPFDTAGNIQASLWQYFTPYTLLAGALFVLLCLMHGLNYLSLKTTDALLLKVTAWRNRLTLPLIIVGALFAFACFFQHSFKNYHPVFSSLLLGLLMLSFVMNALTKGQLPHFISTGLSLISLTLLLIASNFPILIVNTKGANLTVSTAASGPTTLLLMSKIALVLVPIILLYQTYSFYIFRKRLTVPQ